MACVRPLPGDNEASSTTTPAEVDTGSESAPYPAPPEAEGSDTSAEEAPAEESYPAGEEGGSSESELLQPTEEGESAEAYPGVEGEATEGEHAEGEATEGDSAEGEHTEGEAAEGEDTEDETTEGEATEGEVGDGEHTEGEAAESEHTEGEAGDGEHAEDEAAESEHTEGEATESEATEGAAAEGETVETGRTHTVARGETLFRIGMQYGMSWVTLAQANDITNPNSLYIGQVLVIPDIETVEDTEANVETKESETGEAEAAETETPAASEESEIPAEGEVLTVYVGPELIECVGVGPAKLYAGKNKPGQ